MVMRILHKPCSPGADYLFIRTITVDKAVVFHAQAVSLVYAKQGGGGGGGGLPGVSPQPETSPRLRDTGGGSSLN